MIEILEILPTIYLWLYILLAFAFVVQGSCSLRPAVATPEGGEAPDVVRRIATAATTLLFALALGTHLTHFTARWIINGHWPLQSKHEVFTATGLTTMIYTLILYLTERVWRLRGAQGLLTAFVFLLLTGCGGILWTALGMREDYKVHNMVPALQSAWHPPHVSAYMLGYGSLGLASLLAFVYILGVLGKRIFGGETFFQHMASPLVEGWTYKIAGLGFPFMTAALCMGALWADASWGTYWFWDAKETWALISWASFVVFFHLRYIAGWNGLNTMLVVFGGGAMIGITYMWIHVLPASQAALHVYN
jgi:ABC-type transport system involved in cytochrome c biogenesis permease subunit